MYKWVCMTCNNMFVSKTCPCPKCSDHKNVWAIKNLKTGKVLNTHIKKEKD